MTDDQPEAPPPLARYPPPAYPPPAPAREKWLARNKFLAIAAAIAAIYFVRVSVESRRARDEPTATSSNSGAAVADSEEPSADESSTDFVPRPRPSVTPTTAAAPMSPSVVAPPPAPAKREDVDFVMPDYRGRDLQSAQNDVQRHGVFLSRSHDLRGSRRQVLDRNWTVCEQSPAAGVRVHGDRGDLEGDIDFGVVKDDEACP